MPSYIATGPPGRFSGVRLRIHAGHVKAHPEPDKMKVVVQVIANGAPIVEDPIQTHFLTMDELQENLEWLKGQGWSIDADTERRKAA